MKVTRTWLQKYFDQELPPVAELADAHQFGFLLDHAEQRVIGRLGELKRDMKPGAILGVASGSAPVPMIV